MKSRRSLFFTIDNSLKRKKTNSVPIQILDQVSKAWRLGFRGERIVDPRDYQTRPARDSGRVLGAIGGKYVESGRVGDESNRALDADETSTATAAPRGLVVLSYTM